MTSKDYALLSKDAYNNRTIDQKVTLGGVTYKVVDIQSDPITGFQGTAYQRLDTNEIVVANRGTEKNWGVIQDAATDLGMVITGFNAQMPDARAFAKRVKQEMERDAATQHYVLPPITTTGHSLGGAITEVMAHEMGWHGVTFNGYGAADLGYHLPEGGTQVINYVRATDVVSAASHHYGKVIELATAEDIEQLRAAGYHDHATADSLRNPMRLRATSFAAHSINNFAPDDPSITPSDLSPENEARARAHGKAIHLFREDMQALRSNTLSLPWELRQKEVTAARLAADAASAILRGDFDQARHITSLAEQRAVANTHHVLATTTHTASLSASAIDHIGTYTARHFSEAAATVVDQRPVGSFAVEPLIAEPHHAAQASNPALQPDHAQATKLPAIDANSSTHDMFEALYQASITNDDAAIRHISEAYLQSVDGQAFLQMGRDFNRQQDLAQAAQKAQEQQQAMTQAQAQSRSRGFSR